MTFYGLCNESLRLQIAGSFGQAQHAKDRNACRLLMFLEVKSTSDWWVTCDTTISIGDMKRLGAWFRILSKDRKMVNHRLRLGKEALAFGYHPIKDSSGLLFIYFSRRLAPERRKRNGEFYSDKSNYVMCRFKRAELKRIAATLRRELYKHAHHPERLEGYYKPVRIERRLTNV